MKRKSVRKEMKGVILDHIEYMNGLDKSSDEHGYAVNELIKMYEAYGKEGNYERYVKIASEVGITGATLVAYNIWTNKGYKFETTGVLTSNVFKNFLKNVRPKK